MHKGKKREEWIKNFKGNLFEGKLRTNSNLDFFANSETLDKILSVRVLYEELLKHVMRSYISVVWSIIAIISGLQSNIYLCNRR